MDETSKGILFLIIINIYTTLYFNTLKIFSPFITNIKKIVNFYYSILRFWNTCITNKKAHDFIASILVFLFVIHFETFQISES